MAEFNTNGLFTDLSVIGAGSCPDYRHDYR